MKPMLATRGDRVPQGAAWIHEVKWDGIRALVEVSAEGLRITTRNEKDITAGVPELAGLVDMGRDMVLDGEIVALSSGRPSFSAIASRLHVFNANAVSLLADSEPATLIIFDLLRLDGIDLTPRPLHERRALLEALEINGAAWQVPPTYDDGAMLMEAVDAQGLEGIVSKKVSSAYYFDRRSTDWLKFPIRRIGSYVIGGFRFETGSDSRLGAVLIGEPTRRGIEYRGRVGSGIAGKAGQALKRLLVPLVADGSPFGADLPRADVDGTVWVEPRVIVDVQYREITKDQRLRHPAYRGIRSDLEVGDL